MARVRRPVEPSGEAVAYEGVIGLARAFPSGRYVLARNIAREFVRVHKRKRERQIRFLH